MGEREGNQRGVMGGRRKEERGPKKEESKECLCAEKISKKQ